jgi:hypothetical protein
MLEQSTGTPPSIVADQAKPIGKADHKQNQSQHGQARLRIWIEGHWGD